jgi:5'-deoxynucleotidase YfbR-like HD superfamily hydrolase
MDHAPHYVAKSGDICDNCGQTYMAHLGVSSTRRCPGFRLAVQASDSPSTRLEDLNVRELLLGDVTRLAHVYRFSSVLVLKRESTAEHTFFTTWFSLCLALWVEKRVEEGSLDVLLSLSMVLKKAVCHDLEECRTGDINRLFKHSDPALRAAINSQSQVEARRAISPLFGDSSESTRRIWEAWNTSKDSSYEGLIVALADYMSVLSFMWSEIRCSNQTMLRYHEEMLEYVKGFSSPVFDFLRPVVDEVQAITYSLFSQRVRARLEEIF